jgi:hypothetical protein
MTVTAGIAFQLAGHAVAWTLQARAGTPIFTTEQLVWAAFNLATKLLPDVAPNVLQAAVRTAVRPEVRTDAPNGIMDVPSVVGKAYASYVMDPQMAGNMGSLIAKAYFGTSKKSVGALAVLPAVTAVWSRELAVASLAAGLVLGTPVEAALLAVALGMRSGTVSTSLVEGLKNSIAM